MAFYIPPNTSNAPPVGPGFFSFGNPANPPLRTMQSLVNDRNDLIGYIPNVNPTMVNTYQYPTTAPRAEYNQADTAMDSIQEANPLSAAFFSLANMENIQQLLQKGVFSNSAARYVIGRQSDTELLIIMRGLYLQFARYNPSSKQSIQDETQRLNQMVVDFCVPKIISSIMQYKDYLRDISTPLQFPPAPVNASIKGTTLLRPVTDVLVGDPFN